MELSLTSLQASHSCPTPSCPRWDGLLSTAIYVHGQMFTEACEAVCSVCAPVAFCSGGIKLLEHCSLGISVWGPRTPRESRICKVFPFPTVFLCKVRFSSYSSAKQCINNRSNADADMRIWLSSVQTLKRFVKQCHFSHHLKIFSKQYLI